MFSPFYHDFEKMPGKRDTVNFQHVKRSLRDAKQIRISTDMIKIFEKYL